MKDRSASCPPNIALELAVQRKVIRLLENNQPDFATYVNVLSFGGQDYVLIQRYLEQVIDTRPAARKALFKYRQLSPNGVARGMAYVAEFTFGQP